MRDATYEAAQSNLFSMHRHQDYSSLAVRHTKLSDDVDASVCKSRGSCTAAQTTAGSRGSLGRATASHGRMLDAELFDGEVSKARCRVSRVSAAALSTLFLHILSGSSVAIDDRLRPSLSGFRIACATNHPHHSQADRKNGSYRTWTRSSHRTDSF